MRAEINNDTGRLSITPGKAAVAFATLGLSEPGDLAMLVMGDDGVAVAQPLEGEVMVKTLVAHLRRKDPEPDKHAQTERITQEIREPAVRETPSRVDEPEGTGE